MSKLQKGQIVAGRLYDTVGGYTRETIGTHASVALPNIAFNVIDHMGETGSGGMFSMGTTEMQKMDVTVSLKGHSDNDGILNIPLKLHKLELVEAQSTLNEQSHDVEPKSVKHFMSGYAVSMAGGTDTKGSANDHDAAFSLIRYEKFVDGKQIALVDLLNKEVTLNGTDYTKEIRSLIE